MSDGSDFARTDAEQAKKPGCANDGDDSITLPNVDLLKGSMQRTRTADVSANSEFDQMPSSGGASTGLPGCEVIELDRAIKCEAGRTARSTCYRDKYVKLSVDGRHRVDAMEKLLFDENRRAASCLPGDLHLPDSRFDCADGSIWYHFSLDRKLFVLAYFELNSCGGGMTGPGSSGLNNFVSFRGRPYRGWGDGIAARLAQLFEADWSDAADIDLVAWLTIGATKPIYHVRIDDLEISLDEPAPRGRLLIDIAVSCHMLCEGQRESVLPAWSMLYRATHVKEQLANPYARAIFAGEALCRIGYEIEHSSSNTRALRSGSFSNRKRAGQVFKHDFTSLFLESASILDAVRNGKFDAKRRKGRSHFLAASLMDGDIMADLRQLALIRNEMTYRLAMAVGETAQQAQRKGRCPDANRDLLHRYAMLSEFVRLSVTYFGVVGASTCGGEFVDELDQCEYRDRTMVKALVRDLDDFGSSTMMIVEHLSPPAELDDLDVDVSHSKLYRLALDILIGHELHNGVGF